MDKNLPARKEAAFDLTTEAGRKRALEAYLNWQHTYFWMISGLWTFSLLKRGYDFITQREIDTLEAQKTAAIDLLKAGKEQDLETMKITMDQTVGLDLGSEVEGIPVKAKIGKSGHMIVEAKYKN